jgi:hypothetical protein
MSPRTCTDLEAQRIRGEQRQGRSGRLEAPVARNLFAPYKGWRAETWLFLSSFGIAFALLSWLELAKIKLLEPVLATELRGLVALILGTPFYLFIGRLM